MSWAEDEGYDMDVSDYLDPSTDTMYHCGVVHETPKALLMRISTNYGVWIPKSLITVFDEDMVTYRDVIKPTITPLIK